MKKFLKNIGVFVCSIFFAVPFIFALVIAIILVSLFEADEEYNLY